MSRRNRNRPRARDQKAERSAAFSQRDKEKNREEQQARAAAAKQCQPAVPVIQEPAQPQVPEDLPPEPEPAPKPQRIPLEKSIQNQCAAYKTQGYEPTHSICSILAYMIGVDGDYFVEEPHSRLEKGVFDRADQRKDLQLVRQLCILRNLVMRNCQEFSREIYRERRILSRLPAGMLDTLYLRFGKDLSPRDRTRTLGDYLIQINQEIRQAVDAVQNTTLRLFLPECVDPALIAKLIPFPDAIREQRAAWDLCVLYFNNRRRYPWQCYMNIEPSDFGEHNPLGGDDEIVRYAYALAHREFHKLWSLRTPYPPKDSKETLHRFLDGKGHYTFCILIDGTSVAVNEVLAILKELTPQELEMFETQPLDQGKSIRLYCCNDVFRNWRFYLGEYETYIQPVEVISTVRDADRLEDISTNCSLSAFWMPSTTAVILVTRNPRVFRDCWHQAGMDRKARCLITSRHADDSILDAVVKDSFPYAFWEDFTPQSLQNTVQAAQNVLQKEFPIETPLNLHTLLDESLRQIPIDYTQEERKNLYRQLRDHLQLQVTPDGDVCLLYNGADASS